MGKIIFAASAVLVLCGCAASEGTRQVAMANCQAVGITQKDPQFETCMKSFAYQHIEAELNENYHETIRAVREPKLGHNDLY
jgi:uncharacterized protein YecT (DUF1311 family)